MNSYLVDLAYSMPEDLAKQIGEVTILFGRLEHMVLLAIKRLRGIPLVEAQQLYKGYSIGAKLFGKQSCTKAGGHCRNYGSEIGLRELSKGNQELESICAEIKKLTEERNRLMHGLITTVVDSSVIFHNKKIYSVTESKLWEIKDSVIQIITRLNDEIPIPGIHASWASGPDLAVCYDDEATASEDPMVTILNNIEEH